MNKSELIAAVAEKAGVAKSVADNAVNAMIDAVAGALKAGDKVAIAGFGNFEVKERAAREGRNPATGEAITIAASKTVAFKASKALKESI
ncbi:MAG TPA: HU family DNA-binding protein [Candidatus Ornithoclostridium faecigallinarum]|nr:HU family DNA-binding protein [Candidatus Ornithoclostridium faecigallinarum]